MSKITYLITVYNEVKTVKKAIQDVIDIKYKIKKLLLSIMPQQMEAN